MNRGIDHLRGKAVQALCAAAWLCGACACTLEPRYRAPALPVPDQWPTSATTLARPAENGAARDIGWRDFFVDQRLEQLIDLALANNRDLRVAVLKIQGGPAPYLIPRAPPAAPHHRAGGLAPPKPAAAFNDHRASLRHHNVPLPLDN